MKTNSQIPLMDAPTAARFQRDALALFRAGWDSFRVADWAMSAASGFGRYWQSRSHAREAASLIVRAYNAEQRRIYNDAMAKVASDPTIQELMRLTGAKLRRR